MLMMKWRLEAVSSHNVKTIEQGAILVANDLLTGRLVYRTKEHSWSVWLDAVWVFTDLEQAEQQLAEALLETSQVNDPYLAATDRAGRPEHIREAIRVLGPTFLNASAYQEQGYTFIQSDR